MGSYISSAFRYLVIKLIDRICKVDLGLFSRLPEFLYLVEELFDRFLKFQELPVFIQGHRLVNCCKFKLSVKYRKV